MMAIYNARLIERERRRAFVAERGLLNVKAQQVRWLPHSASLRVQISVVFQHCFQACIAHEPCALCSVARMHTLH